MKRSHSEVDEDKNVFADNIKIIVIGDGSTGKSSFVNLIKNQQDLTKYKYKKDYNPTHNFDLDRIKLNTNKGSIIIDLWDTAGQENYGKLRDAYIKGADGVLVFYDISEKKTIENVSNWLGQVKKIAPNIPVAVIGNKSDKFANIQQANSVKIRECNLQRDINHSKIKNYLISIKNNSHLEFNTSGWLFSTPNIEEITGCMIGLEYLLSTICDINIKIK
jgi:GTP-binding nuclear protein Ran